MSRDDASSGGDGRDDGIGVPGDSDGGGASGGSGTDPAVVVQRVNENGTVVETMVVYENESVRVRPAGNGSVAPTPANATATNATGS